MHQDQLLTAVKLITCLDTLVVFVVDILDKVPIAICHRTQNGRLGDLVFFGKIVRFVDKKFFLKFTEDVFDSFLTSLLRLFSLRLTHRTV